MDNLPSTGISQVLPKELKDEGYTTPKQFVEHLEWLLDEPKYTPRLAAMKARFGQLMAAFSAEEKSMGIESAQLAIGSRNSDHNEARRIDGKHYVLLDGSDVTSGLESDMGLRSLKGIIGHELTHIKNKDIDRAVLDPAQIRDKELRADLGGTGPLGSHDPEAFKKFMEKNERNSIGAFNADSTNKHKISPENPTLTDLNRVSAWNELQEYNRHPNLGQREQALTDLENKMKKYESTHHSIDKAQESAEIIREVLQDMQGKLNPAFPNPLYKPFAPKHKSFDESTHKPVSMTLTNDDHAKIAAIGDILKAHDAEHQHGSDDKQHSLTPEQISAMRAVVGGSQDAVTVPDHLVASQPVSSAKTADKSPHIA